MSKPRDYDSTVARMAGNIAAGFVGRNDGTFDTEIVERSVAMARAIVAETKRTEPKEP